VTSERTLQSVVDSLSEHGDKTALMVLSKNGRQRWSFEELAACARSFGNGLVRQDFKRGDAVALFAENSAEWIVAALGIIRGGMVAVPLDVQLGDRTLVHTLQDSKARAIITTKKRVERIEELDLKKKAKLILLDAGEHDEQSWKQILETKKTELPILGGDDGAVLFYTSGTTGPPKGVPLSHGNITSQLEAIADLQVMSETDRVLLPLPLHHVYPFVIGMLAPLTLGLTLVLPFSLSGQQLLRAMREGEVTTIVGVPRLYSALYSGINARVESSGWIARGLFGSLLAMSKFARRLGLRAGKLLFHSLHKRFGEKLRLLASGGAALDPELAAKLEALGWQVAIGYGLTETSPLLTINLPGRSRRDAVGKPFPGVEIQVDPKGVDKEEQINGHDVGEVLARGANVFAGYRNLPDKTAEVFTNDGWFRTGDMGYLDDDGYLHVLGRISTLIKTESGEKIQTEDVEAVYAEESAIREIGVLEKGGKLVALVVPKQADRADKTKDTVRKAIETASKRMPSHQRISDYAITPDALPRTRLGKIQRHRLAERYEQVKEGGEKTRAAGPMSVEEMSGEDRALLEDPAAQSVWELLAQRYRGKRLTPDTSPQFDLGIDSIEWLNVTLEIAESSGVDLTEQAIARIGTVRDLLHEVTEGGEGKSVDPLVQPDQALDEKQKRWIEPLGPVASATAHFLYAVNRALMRLIFQLRAEGLEHLPRHRQWVLTPNHSSYLDSFAIAALLDWAQLRKTYWGGWTGVAFANPVMRFLSRLGKILPVEPMRAARSSLAFGAVILKNKKNLVWFPEGGLSPTGELQDFKPGIGMLLEHFPTSTIPVFIHGTHEALPPGKFFPKPHPIQVVFGQPLDACELKRQGRGEKPHQQIANALHDSVAKLANGRDSF
jgi:long-chain acyl-CoA synthetase